MNSQLLILLGILIGILLGIGLFYLYQYLQRKKGKLLEEEAQRKAEKIISEAENLAKNIISQAEDKAKHILQSTEKEAHLKLQSVEAAIEEEIRKIKKEYAEKEEKKLEELKEKEKKLELKEEHLHEREKILNEKILQLEEKTLAIAKLKEELAEKNKELEDLVLQARRELERIGNLTEKEARDYLLKKLEEELIEEKAKILMKFDREIQEEAKRRAQEIIAYATAKVAIPFVTEKSVSVVELPSEDMKGRIIGREGRNIRTFEALTGVDLLIDDTPEVVVLSCHDPYRREIAKIALERLMADGRIHPTRIEEIVKQVEEEMEQHIYEVGEKACFEMGVFGVHPEILKLLGKLKFRTSYSQNVLQHSLETAIICSNLAAELGLDLKKAKRAALLHDIGKAASYEQEGPHALIGAEIARKYGEDEEIVQAIASHHEDVPITSLLGVLLQVADALSGARPGARRELLEAYLKRIKELESLAQSFPGVEKAYAIQAGREVRVIVDSKKVSDEEAYILAREIAQRIEKELTYPGIIRVTVLRETRVVEYAK